jgi:uncharacterized repeat protein (TIGR02543 family)
MHKVVIVFALVISAAIIGCDNPVGNDVTPPPEAHTVTFDCNGGSTVEPTTVTDGSKIATPLTPVQRGMSFTGWYVDAALTQVWDFATDTVSEDMTLYARWVPKSVSFGSEHSSISTDLVSGTNHHQGVLSSELAVSVYRKASDNANAYARIIRRSGSDLTIEDEQVLPLGAYQVGIYGIYPVDETRFFVAYSNTNILWTTSQHLALCEVDPNTYQISKISSLGVSDLGDTPQGNVSLLGTSPSEYLVSFSTDGHLKFRTFELSGDSVTNYSDAYDLGYSNTKMGNDSIALDSSHFVLVTYRDGSAQFKEDVMLSWVEKSGLSVSFRDSELLIDEGGQSAYRYFNLIPTGTNTFAVIYSNKTSPYHLANYSLGADTIVSHGESPFVSTSGELSFSYANAQKDEFVLAYDNSADDNGTVQFGIIDEAGVQLNTPLYTFASSPISGTVDADFMSDGIVLISYYVTEGNLTHRIGIID